MLPRMTSQSLLLLVLATVIVCGSCRSDDFEQVLTESLKRNPSDTSIPSFLLKYLEKQVDEREDEGCQMQVYEKDECANMNILESLLPRRKIMGKQTPRLKRNALRCQRWLWPEGVVPYKMHIHNKYIVRKFNEAVEEIQSLSCVAFENRNPEIHRNPFSNMRTKRETKRLGRQKTLEIVESRPVPGERCRASVGRVGSHPKLQLSTACTKGNILHELMHVLGFAHEHVRPDRDRFVRIACQNMYRNTTADFRRLKKNVVTSFNEDYDFLSIMHYRFDHFSRNGKDTIIPLVEVDRARVGEMIRLSEKDVTKLNKLYQC